MPAHVTLKLTPQQYDSLRDELSKLQQDLDLQKDQATDDDTRLPLVVREQKVYHLLQEIRGG